ncbi:uncharacterized protein V1518DRAFT_451093 [Limtongia smithiae]|uniref:uncharacterized protein n=1 Tax=Limtongia smithiae TaxID=1125753 RepID=UPI0034CE4068
MRHDHPWGMIPTISSGEAVASRAISVSHCLGIGGAGVWRQASSPALQSLPLLLASLHFASCTFVGVLLSAVTVAAMTRSDLRIHLDGLKSKTRQTGDHTPSSANDSFSSDSTHIVLQIALLANVKCDAAAAIKDLVRAERKAAAAAHVAAAALEAATEADREAIAAPEVRQNACATVKAVARAVARCMRESESCDGAGSVVVRGGRVNLANMSRFTAGSGGGTIAERAGEQHEEVIVISEGTSVSASILTAALKPLDLDELVTHDSGAWDIAHSQSGIATSTKVCEHNSRGRANILGIMKHDSAVSRGNSQVWFYNYIDTAADDGKNSPTGPTRGLDIDSIASFRTGSLDHNSLALSNSLLSSSVLSYVPAESTMCNSAQETGLVVAMRMKGPDIPLSPAQIVDLICEVDMERKEGAELEQEFLSFEELFD